MLHHSGRLLGAGVVEHAWISPARDDLDEVPIFDVLKLPSLSNKGTNMSGRCFDQSAFASTPWDRGM